MSSKKTETKSQARKTSSIPTRIYSYGVVNLSTEALDVIRPEMRNARRYYNKLVEIERNRREAFRNISREMDPQIGENYSKLEKMEEKLKSLRPLLSRTAKIDAHLDAHQSVRLVRSKNAVQSEVREDSTIRAEMNTILDEIKKLRNETRILVDAFFDHNFAEANEKYKHRKDAAKAQFTLMHGKEPQTHSLTKINEALFAEVMAEEGWPLAWKRKMQIENEAHKASIEARANCNCTPGTYLAVEDATKRAFKDSVLNPKFKNSSKSCKIGTQTKTITIDSALTHSNEWVRITRFHDVKIKGRARGRVAATCRLKLGGRMNNAIIIDIPFVMHRPLPKDGVIKWVYLVEKKIGFISKYELQFTLESSTFLTEASECAQGNVHIDPGWASVAGGYRVATMSDPGNLNIRNDEQEYIRNMICGNQIIVSDVHISADQKKDALLSASDDCFNLVKRDVNAWLKGRDLSESITSAAQNIGHWRSHSNLHRLGRIFANEFLTPELISSTWKKWKVGRVVGLPTAKMKLVGEHPDLFEPMDKMFFWLDSNGIQDENVKMALYLEWWRRKDAHLVNWARRLSKRFELRRKEAYRCLAKQLASKYETVSFVEYKGDKKARNPLPENDTRSRMEERGNANRHLVGPSCFLDALTQAFGKNRTTILKRQKAA